MDKNPSPESGESNLHSLLFEERSQLETEREKLAVQVDRAEARMREIDQRLTHVVALLEGSGEVPIARTPTIPRRRDIVDLAAEVLGERNRQPMYYKDLAREVQERGGNLSGDNAPAALVARLVGDDRFVRPTRKGFYALRADYPNATNVGERKRRRRAA
jgi:hypothetical protein